MPVGLPRRPPHHLGAAAAGQVHVEEHHLGLVRDDRGDGLVDVGGLGDDVDRGAELGAYAGAEHGVVVDDHDAAGHGASLGRGARVGSESRTSVPSPGTLRTEALPPWRSIRPTMLLRTPCRSSATAAGSKPDAAVADEHLDAVGGGLGVDVDGAGAGVLRGVGDRLAGREHQGPVLVQDRGVAHADDLDGDAVRVLDLGRDGAQGGGERGRAPPRRMSNSHERRSRSWARASRVTAAGSPAERWIRARVCSTESCRWAATSARSSERTRASRSSLRSEDSRKSHGPTMKPSPRMPKAAARPTLRATRRGSPSAARTARSPRSAASARPRCAARPASRPRRRSRAAGSIRRDGSIQRCALRLVGLPPQHRDARTRQQQRAEGRGSGRWPG